MDPRQAGSEVNHVRAFSGVPDRRLTWTRVPPASLDLSSCSAAVVGGTGGIGRALARLLADHGAQVIVVGRTFRDQGWPGVSFVRADLSLMSEARRVAAELFAETLDLLVLTAGVMAGPRREVTAEGLERDMAVSYLSRLALLRELGPRLGRDRPASAPRPRVFVMGFPGTGQAGDSADLNAERYYSASQVHMNTVAGNEMLVLDSVRRYPNARFYGLNPGLISTDIRSRLLGGPGSLRQRAVETVIGLLTPSAARYAERLVPLLVSGDLEALDGAMFNQQAIAIQSTRALTENHVERFIKASEALIRRAG
jgi:NAD(P)-dependent dehydrogenase (short-subunit alcohol dehydrogenase family)